MTEYGSGTYGDVLYGGDALDDGYGAGLYGDGPYGGAAAAEIPFGTLPVLKVEADFTNLPTTPDRAWTDITSYVRAADWVRAGRSAETERTQPGRLSSLVLDNRPDPITGRPFDRDNPDGPYYGPLSWSFWIRVSFVWDSVAYPQWTGIKDSVPKQRPAMGFDQIAIVTGSDAMKPLELSGLAGLSYGETAAGDRVAAVLADAMAAVGDINPGKPTLAFPAVAFADGDRVSPLAHLRLVEQDERGLLFARADGAIDFQDRYYRALLLEDGPLATIGEADDDIRYRGVGDLDDDNEFLWNVVSVTPAVGTVEVARDEASIEQNWERRHDISSLLESQPQAAANAQWYRNRYGSPGQRVPGVEIVGGAISPDLWPVILAAGNSDVFTWEGGTSTQDVFLERVSGSWRPGEPPQITWELSPAVRDVLWRIGVPGFSEIGLTTRVG